jgi:small conductance mechanosensitive channel
VGAADWPAVLLALAAAAAVSALAAWLAARLVRRLLALVVGSPEAALSPAVRRPVRAVRAVVFLLTALALTFPALELVGVRRRTGLSLEATAEWFFRSGLRIVLVVVLAWVVVRVAGVAARRFEDEVARAAGPDVLERAKRARTLGGVAHKAVTAVVVLIAALMILRELRLDILPLLTGAGIAGVALGFGAQTLVRDLIAGFFIILENQIRVGDVVSLDGASGMVEAINLRTIVLRDFDGTVHIVPAGSVTRIANKTMDYAYAVLDVPVAYEEDVDRVVALLREIGRGLAADPQWQPFVLGELEVFGVEAFADWQVLIRTRMKTVPLKQWDVGRELRRRIKKRFEAEGIAIPLPRREVIMRQGGAAPPAANS